MPKKLLAWTATEWEAHDEASYRKALDRDQDKNHAPFLGERFAMVVNCKSKADLIKMVERGGGGAMEDLIEFIIAAQDSLKMRLTLADAAFARLLVAGEAMVADDTKPNRG